MPRLERAIGSVLAIAGVGIAIFVLLYTGYYFYVGALVGEVSIYEAMGRWAPTLVLFAILAILSVFLMRYGVDLMKHERASRGLGAREAISPPMVSMEARTSSVSTGPFETPGRRPPEVPHVTYEVPETPWPPRPSATRTKPTRIETPPAPPETGETEIKEERREAPPAEVRPALDDDELSRIIRILRERRRRS